MVAGSLWGAVLCVWVRGWCRHRDDNLAGDPGLWKEDKEKPGAGYGREKRKRSTEGGEMEVELQSWGAGRGTRSRAVVSAVRNWKLSGNLSADGKSRMRRERAPEEERQARSTK